MSEPNSELLYEEPIPPKLQVNKEFYGESAQKYEQNMAQTKKSDLMAQHVNWKEACTKAEIDSPLKSQDLDARQRMY